jgi:predicted nuclease with TOPRIM domain
MRLTVALSSLEDSIKRRDEEIEQLRVRIAELEEQLRSGDR